MPEMHFIVRWPDETETRCYSPSLVIRDYFQVGERYALPDFVRRSREALSIASERVRKRFGYPCSQALRQLDEIDEKAATFADDTYVKIASFNPD